MFAFAIECFGWYAAKRDARSGARYDWLAHEMARLPPAAHSSTAITGAILGFLPIGACPRFMEYPTDRFASCRDSGIG